MDRGPGPAGACVRGPAEPLVSRQAVEVAVRVWGPDGGSEWSEPITVRAGLLARTDWSAGLVRPPRDGDDRCAYLRREFDASQVVTARLYATAQGVYECLLNGAPISP
ncbi:MAG TPA: alpha-L-rhamnosidase, partial [Actinotalea sp.]|nr:alpha-L-rhamnosidase [Actinotalea sp.]